MTASMRLAELGENIGRPLGPSRALVLSQERIDAFAACTEDPQWIHVDPERAATSAFGSTIAHGFLTLSLLSTVMDELVRVEDAPMAINYGLERVRFPAPALSGSTVRATAEIIAVEVTDRGTTMRTLVTFTADGADRPCCVAESLTRYPVP